MCCNKKNQLSFAFDKVFAIFAAQAGSLFPSSYLFIQI
jgi:hypothetical protein